MTFTGQVRGVNQRRTEAGDIVYEVRIGVDEETYRAIFDSATIAEPDPIPDEALPVTSVPDSYIVWPRASVTLY